MDMNRVSVVNLEMNVAFGCNLKCEYCTHLGRFMKGTVPLVELLYWYETWNKKIRPQNVRIMGGEPLLHPDLESIIYETRNFWDDSNVELITNGLLLPKMKSSIFVALKEIGAEVRVSQHFDDPYFNRILDAGIKILRRHNIRYDISRSNWYWMKCYRIDDHGNARPYQSDPQKAWDICYVQNKCTTLIDNKLYRCPQLGCFAYACKKGFVSSDWNVALEYQPLEPDCTYWELREFMNGGACDQCSICPEEFEYADMYEKINLFGLPTVQKLFCGVENHE